MRIFVTHDQSDLGGALCKADGFYTPSATDGSLVYLNANPDVQQVLDKVEPSGGAILVPKTEISPDHGYIAVIKDTEGNRIALHAVSPDAVS
jgi:hypothetical protein